MNGRRFRGLWAAVVCAGLLGGCGKAQKTYVIEIDIDDHGLSGLWKANAPNLKRLISEGTLAYSRVIVPTHSNESNMTLVTGNWPDGHDVPTNSWLDRDNNYKQALSLGSLGLGDYVFYAKNPLNPAAPHHVDSVWTSVADAGLGATTYVGQLPPWELGADEAHFTIAGGALFGIPVDVSTLRGILQNDLGYPAEVLQKKIKLDGPPDVDAGETVEHFTIRDAAQVWQAAAATEPPPYMFVWAFIALDDDPTSKFGADSAQISAVIDDYDNAIGQLLAAVAASPYKDQVDILFTLDHGKVDTTQQVALGSSQLDGQQLSNLILARGSGFGIGSYDYQILNEDGDALIYIVTDGAGTAAGAAKQTQLTHNLVDLIQTGGMVGVDVTRTITWDGYRGTRRFHDYRIDSPNQADIILFPLPGWTLNNVDGTGVPGPFAAAHPFPYGRHGGFSTDELYVPLIMWGPSFKQGVLLPHPVDHADVVPTAMRALGVTVPTAEGGPVLAAFRGDPGETVADPADMTTSRDLALSRAGFGSQTALVGGGASQAVIVDVPGLYYDELFTDGVTAGHAAAFRELAQRGVVFQLAWNRYRDRAENLFELLTGGAPVTDSSGQWLAGADMDPAMAAPPGEGRLLEPPPGVGTPANAPALSAWRQSAAWDRGSLLSAASAKGFATAVFGDTGTALTHVAAPGATSVKTVSDADAPAALADFLTSHGLAVAVVKLATTRTADRHSSAALSELDAIGKTVTALQAAASGAVFVLTSDGAADVDEPGGDFYGPQSSRHVPLVVTGPNVRSLITRPLYTSQPANAADIPATVLFALGQAARGDFVEGAWIPGVPNAEGVPQPVPAGATAGHVLGRAFSLQ